MDTREEKTGTNEQKIKILAKIQIDRLALTNPNRGK